MATFVGEGSGDFSIIKIHIPELHVAQIFIAM
jgi:hypothetical protein